MIIVQLMKTVTSVFVINVILHNNDFEIGDFFFYLAYFVIIFLKKSQNKYVNKYYYKEFRQHTVLLYLLPL